MDMFDKIDKAKIEFVKNGSGMRVTNVTNNLGYNPMVMQEGKIKYPKICGFADRMGKIGHELSNKLNEKKEIKKPLNLCMKKGQP